MVVDILLNMFPPVFSTWRPWPDYEDIAEPDEVGVGDDRWMAGPSPRNKP
jgi:hypothetical protein